METIELTGTVNGQNQIQIDQPMSIKADTRVRVTLQYESNDDELAKQLQIVDQVMAENENVFRELAK